MHPDDLANLIGRELNALQQPRAPRTLIPRVMMAVHAWAGRPWYQRAWFTWPLAWQALTLTFIIACVAGITWGLSSVSPVVAGVSSDLLHPIHPWLEDARTALQLMRTLSRTALAFDLRLFLISSVLLIGAVSVALGAALGRVAFPRTQQS